MHDSPAPPKVPRREVVGAWLLVFWYAIGCFGLVWDVEWHSDVGPDTFFTAPHLLIYASQAGIGLTSLAVVLLASLRGRQLSAGPTLTVMKVFRTPLPFLVTGCGAAIGLLYGLADLWWHTVYGFDVTPTSPPHVGLSLSDLICATGAIMAMAALRHHRSGHWGLVTMASIAIGSLTFLLYSTPSAPGVPGYFVAMPVLCALLFAVVLGITRRPAWVAATGLTFAALHLATLLWAPAVTQWYAAAVALPQRDYADPLPAMPLTYPFALPVAAVVVTLLVLAARRWGMPPRWSMPIAGATAAVLVLAGYLVLGVQIGVAGWLIAAVAGAGAGWFGWHAGTMMHLLAPDPETARPAGRDTPVGQPVAVQGGNP